MGGSRRALGMAVGAAVVGCAVWRSNPICAQTSSGWKGTGTTNKWSDTGNWDNGVPGTTGAQGSVRNLFFGASYNTNGGTQTTSSNDLSVNGFRITFESTASDHSFTLSGNSYTLFDFGGVVPRIENDSSVAQNVNMAIGFSGTNAGGKAEANPVNGNLNFGSTVDLAGTTLLQIFGSNGKTVTFSGAISSSGNSGANGITIQGASYVVFAGTTSSSYGGATTVNAGTLQLSSTSSDGAIGKASLLIGDGTGVDTVQYVRDTQINDGASITVNSSGVLDFNNHNDTIGSMTVNGGVVTLGTGSVSMGLLTMTGGNVSSTGTGQLKIRNSPTLANSGANAAVISGTLNLNSANRTFTVNDLNSAGVLDADITANIVDNAGQTDNITKFGAGTMRLSGSNSYSGNTLVSQGTLIVSSESNLGLIPQAFNAQDIQIATNTTAGTLATSAAMSLDANRGVTILGLAAINSNGGAFTINGAINANANRLTVTGASQVTFNGAYTSTSDILKQGSGTLLLANSGNSFGTGVNNIFIDKGTVQVSANGAAGASTGQINIGASAAAPAGDGSLLITAANVTLPNPIDTRFFSGVSGGKTIGGSNGSGIATFSGAITLHDNTSLVAASGGQVDFTGGISAGSINGSEIVNTSPPTDGFGTGPGIIINTSIAPGGTVESTGVNTYSGDTVVNSGTLQFNSSFTNSSTIRLGASSGSQDASLSIAKPGGATFGQVVNVRPGSSGVKTISASNTSGTTTTFSNHLALDDNATILSTNSGATLSITQTRSTPTDTGSGFDIKGFTATFDGAGNTTVSGTIYNSVNNGNLIKQGAGALTLSGNNTYSGTTAVSAGKLVVNGTHTGGGAYTISGGTLAGSGNITASSVSIGAGGTISPGNSIGTLTLNSGVSIAGTYNAEIDFQNNFSLQPTADLIVVSGSNHDVDLSGTLQLQFLNVPSVGHFTKTVTVLQNNSGGTLTGNFTVTLPAQLAGLVSYSVNYNANVGGGDSAANDVTVTLSAVPEPSSFALLVGLPMLAARRPRKRLPHATAV